MKILFILSQVLLLVLISPLVSGVIRKIKNNLRMRTGAGIFQPYYNLIKLFGKEEVVSANITWIFNAAPYVVIASTITAVSLVPVVVTKISMYTMGDFLLIIFLLSLGRFFMALSAIDTGSSFGGMGSSREMFLSAIVEPAAVLAVFAVAVSSGSTSLTAINIPDGMYLSRFLAAVALFFVAIAETSRLPVDNQETHLELTMVHEAMVLEYSGRSLALIELAGHVKQLMFFILIANVLIPCGYLKDSSLYFMTALVVAKVAGLCIIVSILETSIAKLRLFRVVDFLGVGFVFSILAFVFALMRI
jgi:formate hydrogenlyase subunit 4